MKEQNYKAHARWVPIYHFITGGLILAVLIGSIVNLVNSSQENLYSASLLVAVSLILVSLFWYARAFALRAQDRAIRAEENFRHFVLTGKPMDHRLKMGQIIALRFCSDEEFSSLAQKAVDENLKSYAIKSQIKIWRPDHHRV